MTQETQKLLLSTVEGLQGKIGFYAHCTTTGETLAIHENEPLMAASVIKLTIMAEAFRRFCEGTLDRSAEVRIRPSDKLPSCGALTYLHDGLTVTVLDLVTLMIILSDNTATNLLIDLLGADAINRTIGEMGLTGTRLNRKLFMPELSRQGIENYVTATDMGTLLEMLTEGKLWSKAASAEMLGILKNQRLNGKLPFYLHSAGIPVAHKTGEDDGITHDVGVIFGQETWIVCFLSNETDVPDTERAMQDVAAWLAGVQEARA